MPADDAPMFVMPATRAPRRARSPRPRPVDASETGSLPPDELRVIQILGTRLAMTTDDVVRKSGLSAAKVRASLKALIAAGRAGQFRDGRLVKYWSRATGARPDLGLKARITTVRPMIDRATAEAAAHGLVRSKILGFIGENEAFEEAQLVYRLLYRVAFEERVKKSLLARLVGPTHEQRIGSVYMHPRRLAVLQLFANGIKFATELPVHASEVEDLDGVTSFVEVPPGDISFDEDEWRARREPAEVKQQFRRMFHARPGAVSPVFVPLWKLVLRRGAGASFRVVTLDALVGRPVDWP